MKSFQVVIVTILFMALLMTSDAGKGGKCKKQLKKVKKELRHCKTDQQKVEERNTKLETENAELQTELQKVGELNTKLQTENAELQTELQELDELNNQLQNETAECETKLQDAEECQNYQTLSDGDRKNTYISSATAAGNVGCDHNLGPAWFRFQGDAGTKMATSCVPAYRCGTDSTGWLNGAHPTVNEGQVTRQACFSWSGNCCTWSIDIKVRNCGDFYVYYINKTPPEHMCHLRYCGTD